MIKRFENLDNLVKNGTEVLCTVCPPPNGPCVIGRLALAESPIELPVNTDTAMFPDCDKQGCIAKIVEE